MRIVNSTMKSLAGNFSHKLFQYDKLFSYKEKLVKVETILEEKDHFRVRSILGFELNGKICGNI